MTYGALCVTGSHASAKPIDLAPRFAVNETVYYVTSSTIRHHVRVELADVDETILVRTESGMSITPVEVDTNGAATLSWVLHYFAIETDKALPGISEMLDYDSRKPGATASPLAPMFGAIVDKPVTVRVDASGRVVEFVGLADPVGADPLDALARSFFSREAFEQLPVLVTAGAPRPAKVRSKWSRTTAVPMPLGAGTLDMAQEFTFPRIKPRQSTAVILMKGSISKSAAGGGSTGGAPGATLTVDRGQMEGAYTWNFTTGILESAETALDLTTTLSSILGPMRLRQEMSSVTKSVRLPKRIEEPAERPSGEKSGGPQGR